MGRPALSAARACASQSRSSGLVFQRWPCVSGIGSCASDEAGPGLAAAGELEDALHPVAEVAPSHRARGADALDELVLCGRRVLMLVDDDGWVTPREPFGDSRRVTEQLAGALLDVREARMPGVHGARAERLR